MRPSRIVVGEVRQAESLDLLLALNSGLPGMASIHANSARSDREDVHPSAARWGERREEVCGPHCRSVSRCRRPRSPGRDGRRRVREIVAVPGRVEGDVIGPLRSSTVGVGPWCGATAFLLTRSASTAPVSTCTESSRRTIDDRVGAGAHVGCWPLLVWSSFWVPPAERRSSRMRDRLADEIVQSGIPGLGVGTLIAFALGTFAIVFVIFQLVVGAAPLALCFALMAGWSPIVFVRVRARRRRARLRELWPDAIDNVASGVRRSLPCRRRSGS